MKFVQFSGIWVFCLVLAVFFKKLEISNMKSLQISKFLKFELFASFIPLKKATMH